MPIEVPTYNECVGETSLQTTWRSTSCYSSREAFGEAAGSCIEVTNNIYM